MTSELEKTFFDKFGIKQREYTQCCSMGCKKPYTDCVNCQYHEVYKIDYPQITDRILLELICIVVKFQKDNNSYLKILSTTKDDIKAEILDMLIHREFALKHQVQELFKEGKNDKT